MGRVSKLWHPVEPIRWIRPRHGAHRFKQHVVAVTPERDRGPVRKTATLCGTFIGPGYGVTYWGGEPSGTAQRPLVTVEVDRKHPICAKCVARLARTHPEALPATEIGA